VTEIIELDQLDSLGAGAFGVPGERTFLVQAIRAGEVLSVLLEKEQVRILGKETLKFLDRLDEEHPDPTGDEWGVDGSVREAVPNFRARVLGIGWDQRRARVVIELREWPEDEEPDDAPEARVARLFATRSQARAMARNGMAAVESGRPLCQLCELPMDPTGHWCPRSN
jgi:uncharacterized repeat protein (TIGR03847 family)